MRSPHRAPARVTRRRGASASNAIHCSERDTQITDQPKEVDEFVNTWSVEGFREEGTTTAEMGWGTHEKELPPLAYEHGDGPRNQIVRGLNRPLLRRWEPARARSGAK